MVIKRGFNCAYVCDTDAQYLVLRGMQKTRDSFAVRHAMYLDSSVTIIMPNIRRHAKYTCQEFSTLCSLVFLNYSATQHAWSLDFSDSRYG